MTARALGAEVCDDPFACENRLAVRAGVSAVGPSFRIPRTPEEIEGLTVVLAGRGHLRADDQLALQVGDHMALVTIEVQVVLLGPAGVAVLVGQSFGIV